ncbi:MAG: TrkA C-terminal domain-containing protein, partial [Anaeromyxobacteraceae bacterium]
MDWLVKTLQQYPEIAIFLALAIGFLVGPLKIGRFSLGNVTAVLLAGVLIGQLNITISPNVKSVFFLMFLFAVGYGVGPQFFRGIKSDGVPQAIFAAIVCLAVLLSAYVAARLAGYNAGLAAGLLSGAATISAVLGVATDTIKTLGVSPEQAKAWTDVMPVAYAVTYLFGTAGSAWFLASVGPRLLRIDLAKECKAYEDAMGGSAADAGSLVTYPKVAIRAYKVDVKSKFVGRPIAALESALAGTTRGFVEAIRHGSRIEEPDPEGLIRAGDVLAVAASREAVLRVQPELGIEADDRELLDFPAEIVDVVLTNKALDGKTIKQIAEQFGAEGRGVFLRRLIRQGQEMPFNVGTTVNRGDVLQIAGAKRDVERAIKGLGYADRP